MRVEEKEGKIKYSFKEAGKDPEKAKKIALKTVEKVGKVIDQAQAKARKIMENFRVSIQEE